MSHHIQDGANKPKPAPPSNARKRLFNMVQVEFRTNFLKVDYDAQRLHLSVGQDVVVETSRGPTIARVTGQVQRQFRAPDDVFRVVRVATPEDVAQAQRNAKQETQAYRFALERVRSRRLPMKLIRAQLMQDQSKIVFFFSADGRIDFRELVKDLAHQFRTRIEMHQIGVRDGARMVGGIGPCGRELCCSTFLEHFAPVSIRMAKDQGLTLNPRKVSGMCGRLMCCLVYEQQLYKKMRRKLPRLGTPVFTELGPGKITSVDVINSRVGVVLEDHNFKLMDLHDVTTKEPLAAQVVDDASVEVLTPDFLWDDVAQSYAEDDALVSVVAPSDKPARPASKRRRAKRRPKDTSGAQAKPAKEADAQQKRRRRKRRPKSDSEPKKQD